MVFVLASPWYFSWLLFSSHPPSRFLVFSFNNTNDYKITARKALLTSMAICYSVQQEAQTLVSYENWGWWSFKFGERIWSWSDLEWLQWVFQSYVGGEIQVNWAKCNFVLFFHGISRYRVYACVVFSFCVFFSWSSVMKLGWMLSRPSTLKKAPLSAETLVWMYFGRFKYCYFITQISILLDLFWKMNEPCQRL